MINATIELTPASLATFLVYANDAGNWDGNPWVSSGNVYPTKEQRGNLSDLVQKGLIEIYGAGRDTYVKFTKTGIELGAVHNIDLNF